MTELLNSVLPSVFALVGFVVGAFVMNWLRSGPIYMPPLAAELKSPTTTELEPCEPAYKPGDMVLVKSPGTTETLELTETHPWFMSGKQRINPDHIIGGYRP